MCGFGGVICLLDQSMECCVVEVVDVCWGRKGMGVYCEYREE